MRKSTILFFVSILTLTSCEEGEIAPTADDFKLIRILNYSNSADALPYGTVVFSYDERGNLIKESTMENPNTVITYNLYEYSGNQMTKKKIYDGRVGDLSLGTYINYYYVGTRLTREELYLANGTLKYSTFYEFEGDNLVNTYKVDDNLGVHHQYKYTFDNLNRLTLQEVFMYDQERDEFTKYFYDNLNRQVKRELYNHAGILTTYVESVYDGARQLPVEERYFNSSGILAQTIKFTYDTWGNTTENNVTGQDINCRIFERTYNGELLTEEIKYHPYFGCSEWTVTRYEYGKK